MKLFSVIIRYSIRCSTSLTPLAGVISTDSIELRVPSMNPKFHSLEVE